MNINATGYIHSYANPAIKKIANPLSSPDGTSASKNNATSDSASLSSLADKASSAAQEKTVFYTNNSHMQNKPYGTPNWDTSLTPNWQASVIPSWQVDLLAGTRYICGPTGEVEIIEHNNQKYLQVSNSERAEYNELLQKHMQELYEKNGLSNAVERYNALKSVPGLNEKLRDELKNNLAADERMTALMQKLEVSMA
nr:hypothetical protein [uncultured Pseudomonas sp.]